MRVLVFGDSIAQGYYDYEGGWVERLRAHYDKELIDNKDSSQPTVFNLGISGDTTQALLKRIDNEITARIWPGEEFMFVIAIGINDTVYRGDEHDSEPSIYAGQLSEIHATVSKYSQHILYVGMTPVVDELLQPMPWSTSGKCYATERVAEFDKTLRTFCTQKQAEYIDLWSAFTQSKDFGALLYDGAHPNSKGHELIFQTVLPNLDKILGEAK